MPKLQKVFKYLCKYQYCTCDTTFTSSGLANPDETCNSNIPVFNLCITRGFICICIALELAHRPTGVPFSSKFKFTIRSRLEIWATYQQISGCVWDQKSTVQPDYIQTTSRLQYIQPEQSGGAYKSKRSFHCQNMGYKCAKPASRHSWYQPLNGSALKLLNSLL